jgi:RNA polymerase sigma factor (sigma-70 family)
MRSDLPGDDELWHDARHGNGRAFAAIFDRHRDRVFLHVLWHGAESGDGEDLVATVFLELWRHRSTARIVDDSLLPWLLATATNVTRNATRARRRYRRLLSSLPDAHDGVDPSELAESRLAFHGRAAPLARALRALPLIDQQLIALTAFEDLSLDEAARALSLSYGAAKTRLSRARKRLSAADSGGEPIGVTP